MRKYFTIGQTAKRLDLEVDTLRKLERAGKIRAVRTSGGHRRFTEEEIDRFRRNRRKKSGAKPKPAKRRGPGTRSATRRHPMSGEFVGTALDSVDLDSEMGEGDFPVDDLDDDDIQPYRPPPPAPPRPNPVPQVTPWTPPKPADSVPPPAPPRPAPLVDSGIADRLQLQTIKNYGRSAIPWNTPAEWEGKVIADLERFVTQIQFPADLSFKQ